MSYCWLNEWHEVQETLKRGTYVGAEVYEFKNRAPYERIHGDFLRYVGLPEELNPLYDSPCLILEMGEEEYNRVMNPNCGVTDDFGELYGDKDGKMLVVIRPCQRTPISPLS